MQKINVPNWSEEVFVITKIKNTVPRTYVISDLKKEKLAGTFYQKKKKKKATEFKKPSRCDTSKIDKKVDLPSLKSEFDKLYIGKLEKVPTGLKTV